MGNSIPTQESYFVCKSASSWFMGSSITTMESGWDINEQSVKGAPNKQKKTHQGAVMMDDHICKRNRAGKQCVMWKISCSEKENSSTHVSTTPYLVNSG